MFKFPALELVLGVLQALADNIQPIIEAGANCAIGFMTGLANKLPEVIAAGIDLALSFIEGVAEGLLNNQDRIQNAVTNLVNALIQTFVSILTGLGKTNILQAAKDFAMGFVDGVKAKWTDAKNAVKGMVDKAKEAVSNLGSKLLQAGKDMIQGFINGIKAKAQAVWDAAVGVAENATNAVLTKLGIRSPSRVFAEIGKYTVQGMSSGLEKYSHLAEESASGLADSVIKNVRNPLSNIGKLVDGEIDANPTITPVMDLSNVEQGARRLSDMIGNQDVRLNGRTSVLAGSVGTIQNGRDNSDVISAIKDLKDGLTNNTSYNINGITYDDGSNITNAVETLVRAARKERRI